MIRIAIYDVNNELVDDFAKIINNYFKDNKKIEIIYFDNDNRFLMELKRKDILFDILKRLKLNYLRSIIFQAKNS